MTMYNNTSSSSSSLSRYKEIIGQYEDPSNPLAPLTPAQRQLILDLTHNPAERPIPQHLKPIPKIKTVEIKNPDGKPPTGVEFDKFKFTTKYEVFEVFFFFLF